MTAARATLASLMALQHRGIPVAYGDREVILYALGVGAGRDPLDERELAFVYEGAGLKVLPTMATVLAAIPVAETGLDMARMLHGEQRLSLAREIPAAGVLHVDTGVEAVIDKGAGKGALVHLTSVARGEDGGEVFRTTTSLFARGDGGIGSAGEAPQPLRPVPDRVPDQVRRFTTRADQPLLYRLSGDRHPLHADPALARRAGFPGPLLHGLCSHGMAGRAVLAAMAQDDPRRLRRFDVRFRAPVFPGETLDVALWREDDRVALRVTVVERGIVVLDEGEAVLD